ncbi:tRNA 2-selenouridine(34) synthase MnmH [Algoriphagus sediminis]|uniref:tRNA 2-selenouridine(34) synthase MnmH n=1 Tax=Algoriphagus sediminis TaxID=3057113 RepID=A0ABT7YF25_9BACT|nr:tRNA 2-selenouridine(34) synthase MnmH [Algoriphagus sediminis]MDN3205133.1 tRNA 2-selenouridine(34) synthase MnmH [Algoriphagus sediminis]
MPEQLIDLDEFLALRAKLPIVDARSEKEFEQSHIPNSINIPILNNQERKIVGTLYKQKGNEQATLKGFELVGPRFHEIQKSALENYPEKKILIYCWRGGMRSQILSWLLQMVSFEVYRLEGGYKVYRARTFTEVREKYRLLILAGKTGTGKTQLLKSLSEEGEQVIDLEDLANHRGSSFGGIDQPSQPSVEQFENLLGECLMPLDKNKHIWVENESRRIGKVILPDGFYHQMLKSPLVSIEKTRKERIGLIKKDYGSLDKDELIKAVFRLQKKLGGLRTKQIIELIKANEKEKWIEMTLDYYDKAYDFDLQNHKTHYTFKLDLSSKSEDESVKELIYVREKFERTFAG